MEGLLCHIQSSYNAGQGEIEGSFVPVPIMCGVVESGPGFNDRCLGKKRRSKKAQAPYMSNSVDLNEVPIYKSNVLMVGAARLMLEGIRLGKKMGVSGDANKDVLQKLAEMKYRDKEILGLNKSV
ncbi:hypothetical protein VNO78_23430 [Psophocarpus tetragonolobus]|uniref:Uncharacterized protein n=1 Tax=Psophocarpus tetragonolobus TaxID=3891 RepID=A0AAN9S6P5_PSOTE